jgi:hypothetical protein
VAAVKVLPVLVTWSEKVAAVPRTPAIAAKRIAAMAKVAVQTALVMVEIRLDAQATNSGVD